MNRLRTGLFGKTPEPVEKRSAGKISRKTVKLCELCGTLNHEANKECWTCRWHGCFSRNESTIALAWQRLEAQYEDVRLEHITARRSKSLGDFGAAGSAPLPRRLSAAISSWWRRFQDSRDLRMAQRQARLHSRMPSPPDQLGV